LNNKVTRSFSVGDKDKESILLNNTIPGGATFTEVKAGVRRMMNPWPNRSGYFINTKEQASVLI
jgi:hypothetical protein